MCVNRVFEVFLTTKKSLDFTKGYKGNEDETMCGGEGYGRRRRKNWRLFVEGRVTDLLVLSSAMVAVCESQVGGGVRASACSSRKSAVSGDGQESVMVLGERRTESVGRGGR